jgi:hypothetical protein
VKTLVWILLGLLLLLGSLSSYAGVALARWDSDDNSSTQEAEVGDDDGDDNNFRERFEAAREARIKAYEEAKERRQEALENAKRLREEAREKFRLSLEEIKDERKHKIVENLDEHLAERNEKWVNHFNRVLSRLSQIIAKIKVKAGELAGQGIDVSAVNTQVSEAETAIAAAQEAVDAQALKTYSFEITDEDSLGEAVSETIGEFKDDIKAVWEKVRTARHEVVEAFVALKKAAGEEDEGLSPSPSPTPEPTQTPIPTPI